MDPATAWHSLSAGEAFERIESKPSGLSADEVARRRALYGPNELRETARISPWQVLLSQLKNVLIVILLIAVLLSAFLGHVIEAAAIAIIVLFAVILGFLQEYRAERAIEALRRMAAPTATAIRTEGEVEIPARELVPGDVVLLQTGDRIPADVRLFEAVNLQTDEAALTGESVPVEKQTEPILDGGAAVADRKNMAYAGTVVTYGRGRALVVATGMQTEFGMITGMLEAVETLRTPLQENLDRVGKRLAQAAFAVVSLIVILGLFRGQKLLDLFISGIALAVAVVPEALPAVVTISLAIGVQRMARRHALIRRLSSVETLGSISHICTDKTGTLTKDAMTVRKILAGETVFDVTGVGYEPGGEFMVAGARVEPGPLLAELLKAAVLASDARLVCHEGRWEIKGDPTEGALIVAAAKASIVKADLDAMFPRCGEIPFSSETKRMTTLHGCGGDVVAYAKGAPEIILASCSRESRADGVGPIDGARRDAIVATAREFAAQALRVLAIACKPGATVETAETDMVFLGLAGMIDPPRPEAREAIAQCESAGIKAIMITGDHPLTAQAVGRELGMLKGGRVVTGAELEAMGDVEFERSIDRIEVYARVSPAHKMRVVTALQKQGHVVAMTGDGVNDAPALKKADVGVAMGISGTDVSKEAASMTLTDDNFASIVAAVEEGRGIFDNIKKYLMYLLSSNIGEIGLIGGASVLGLGLPLSAVQILYVNLATDGLPALALSVDPPAKDLMRRKPRDPRVGIFTRPVVLLMLMGGIWSTLINLSLFAWALRSGRTAAEAMTMTFVALVCVEFFKAFCFRSDRHSILRRPFANKWLNLAVLWELILLSLVVYVPFLQHAVGTYGMPFVDIAIIVGVAVTVVPILELGKFFVRRGWFGTVI